MADLFKPTIEWDASGMFGVAGDGRTVRVDLSELSQRFVATIPLPGGQVTRRARKTAADAQAAALAVIEGATHA